jgi:hypothetical protein
MVTNVSDEPSASIFRVNLEDPEDGGSSFL